MHIIQRLIASTFFLFALSAFGEGKSNDNWAENAAQAYEQKAEMAANNGNAENARIYRRMAQIKRDAGAASKSGQKFDWSEYHELSGQLDKGKHKDKAYKKAKKDEHKHVDKKKTDWAKTKSAK